MIRLYSSHAKVIYKMLKKILIVKKRLDINRTSGLYVSYKNKRELLLKGGDKHRDRELETKIPTVS